MLRNIEVWTTTRCNSRCRICHVWSSAGPAVDIGTALLAGYFTRDECARVEQVQFSGGEPSLHPDLSSVLEAAVRNLPRLRKIVVTTNGMNPKPAIASLRRASRLKRLMLTLCVSIEGTRAANKKIRGVDSYPAAIGTINYARRSISGLKTIILATLTGLNCNRINLDHLRKIAASTGSAFSFRPFYSNTAHHSSDDPVLALSGKQKKFIIDYIGQYFQHDDFLLAQREYLSTGNMPVMAGCQAGRLFANIRTDGNIYPCINSTREIGDLQKGIGKSGFMDLGKYEPCPCCAEACFYPMLNYNPAVPD